MHPYLLLKCDLFIKKLACFFKEKKLLKILHIICAVSLESNTICFLFAAVLHV